MYYIYMIRCKDNSIYTGMCSDLERRMEEHFSRNEKCAKYTKQKIAVKLERAWRTETRVDACKLEYRIKQLNKSNKEELILNPKVFNKMFDEKVETNKYFLER